MQVSIYVFIVVVAVLLAALGHARARVRRLTEAVQLAAASAVATERANEQWKAFHLALVANKLKQVS